MGTAGKRVAEAGRSTLALALDQLAAIPDPIQRVDAAVAMVAELKAALAEAEQIRNLGLNELRYQEGYSLRDLATRFHLSKSMIGTWTG